MHGGRSTGPRTQEGLERLRAARTIHGNDNAEARARNRYRITLQRRVRIGIAASYYQDHLHPDARARLYDIAPELWPPSPPTGGITAAIDQMRRRAVAAALLPWKRAIAEARKAHLEARAARLAARAADPHAHPPRPRSSRSASHRPTPEALFAALLAKLHAPERAMPAHDAHGPKPHAPFPDPTNPAATDYANYSSEAPASAVPANATQHTRPTPPNPAGENPHLTGGPKPHAPDSAMPAHDADVPKPLAPIPDLPNPAVPPDLPNRAARRQWARQQRRLHRAPHAATRP